MKESTADSCLLIRRGDVETDGVTILQVDDSCGHGNKKFLDDEEEGSKNVKCKPRTMLEIGTSVSFNGRTIKRTDFNYCMEQESKLKNLQDPSTATALISIRAAIQYIAGCTRPDLCSCVQLLSSAETEPTPSAKTYKELRNIVNRAKQTSTMGLKFVPLDLGTLSMFLFTDASFANADRYASQLGFVICLVDYTGTANILHYGSQRCKMVTRSVMAAELHALSYGFENAFVAKTMVEEVFGQNVPLHGFLHSRTVFNTITKRGAILEKRLQIDAYALRPSHTRGELQSLAWIPTEQNVADALTKTLPKEDHLLLKLMTSNKTSVEPHGWVEQRFLRDSTDGQSL